ncbi:MAG: 2-succinyl-6-hydroxy-2,4-cyclohexadiene-1-carboxylate synthase [Chloroflexi bacterium]|nr:2-succinyl-6-hydroxy-2,4-cyclohexadiene-1-carboxylate synthase [Chloroflexota bacterium]
MAVVHAHSVEFHVVDHGNGPPLVLLHGFAGSSGSWSHVGHDLARHHRVIAIDLIGHGASSAPLDPSRYGFEQALDDLAEVIFQLGLARAAWLGYSMGGRLALGLALRHPNRISSLILESATPGIQDEGERLQRRAADEDIARRIEEIGVEAFVSEWEGLPMWQSQRALPVEVLQHQRELRLRNSVTGLANSLRAMGQGAQPSYWDRLGEIQAPVLLIAGTLDRKYAGLAGQMGIKIPDATLSVIPEAGHAVHLEQPRQFTDAVRAFLSEREHRGAVNGQEINQWT